MLTRGEKILWIILLQYVKTMIDDIAPRNKPQWHLQHSYEVTNKYYLWTEKEALKNYCWQTQWKRFMDCLLQECPPLVEWMACLIHYVTVTWKWYSAFLFSLLFFLNLCWVNIRDSLPGKIINMNHVATELSQILAIHSLNVSGKQDVFSSHQKGYQLINSTF